MADDGAHKSPGENEEFEQHFSSTILPKSEQMPSDARQIKGLDFNDFQNMDITVAQVLDSMGSTGFQASHMSEAVKIINYMVPFLTLK